MGSKFSNLSAHSHAVLLHRPQMRSARDQGHVFARSAQHRADECSDGAGPNYCEFHFD